MLPTDIVPSSPGVPPPLARADGACACARCAVPERISLPGVSKKKKGGRSSPMEVDEEAFVPGDLDTVYINLNKRVDRKKLIQGEMRAQGLRGRRFPARMGDDVKDSIVARQWHSKLNCLYDKKTLPALHTMSKGERGCSGSHIALWKQCLRRNDATKPMLILEDDAVLWERSSVQFPELTQRLIAAVEQVWDVENTPVMLYVGCEVVQVCARRREFRSPFSRSYQYPSSETEPP